MTEAGSTSKASGTGRGRDGSVRVGGWVQGSESGSIEGINLSLEQVILMAPLKYLPPTSRSPSCPMASESPPCTLGDWPTSSRGLYYGGGWDHSHFESETCGHGNRVELAGTLQRIGVGGAPRSTESE